MDHSFEWHTREEKLEVVRYWWREQRGICCICNDHEQIMEPYSQNVISPWAATIEHLIPRRDNGPNTVGNVRLAHKWCNNALGALWQINRDRATAGLPPMSEQWALSSARGNLGTADKCRRLSEIDKVDRKARGEVYRQANAVLPKAIRNVMAVMSQPLPRGATLPPEPSDRRVFEHSAYKPPRRMSALETAQWLRQSAAKQGQKWPLA